MMKNIERKILSQRQIIDQSKKEINENIRMKLDDQNNELDSISLGIRRIIDLMAMQTRNETSNWKRQERFNLRNSEALNATKISIQHSNDNLSARLSTFQNETFGHIHRQIDQMTEMRNQLSDLMNANSASSDSVKHSIDEIIKKYDASVKELKLHFSKMEFSMLSLIQKDDQKENLDDDIMQELDMLSIGITKS